MLSVRARTRNPKEAVGFGACGKQAQIQVRSVVLKIRSTCLVEQALEQVSLSLITSIFLALRAKSTSSTLTLVRFACRMNLSDSCTIP